MRRAKAGPQVSEETRAPRLGDVVTVALPTRDPQGHEQEGFRPAVVVGLPDVLGPGRFPFIVLVPLTSYKGQPWVQAAPERYPVMPAGTARLRSASVALVDQVTAVDATRLRRLRGPLGAERYKQIRTGLRVIMGLG